jgi:hypothetical protein
MKITKMQKILVGLCVVGIAAFIYDRTQSDSSLPGPQQAKAAPMPSDNALPAATPPTTGANAPGAELTIGSHKVLAGRIQTLMNGEFPQTDDIRDAFYAPGLQAPKAVAQTPASVVEPGVTSKPRRDVFAESHTLRGVMVGPDGRMALMDNTCLKIGQKIEEFQLIAVGERSASFVSTSGEKVTFTLPEKPAGQ